MKLRVITCNHGEMQVRQEMDGDLDKVKTYLKLLETDKFKFGAIERLDEMEPGDVSRWMIRRNHTTGELYMSVFSFHDVDPMINVNTYMSIYEDSAGRKKIDSLLGGGKF